MILSVVGKFCGSVVSEEFVDEIRIWVGVIPSSSLLALVDGIFVVVVVWIVFGVVCFFGVVGGVSFSVVFSGVAVVWVEVWTFVEEVVVNVVSFLVVFDMGTIEVEEFVIATKN